MTYIPVSHKSTVPDPFPTDYLQMLRNDPARLKVVVGPNGSIRVLSLDSIFVSPSEQGLRGPTEERVVLTGEPSLQLVDWSQIDQSHMQLGAAIAYLTTGAQVQFMRDLETDSLSILSRGGTVSSEELAFIQLAQNLFVTGEELPVQIETVSTFGNTTTLGEEFTTWLNSLIETNVPLGKELLPEEQVTIKNLLAADPSTVETAFSTLVDIGSIATTPEETVFLQTQLSDLAFIVAAMNLQGGEPLLQTTIPEIMLPLFAQIFNVDDPSKYTQTQKDLLIKMCYSLSKNIAHSNFLSLVGTAKTSQEYATLSSQKSGPISALLRILCESCTKDLDISPSVLGTTLNSIADELAQLDPFTLLALSEEQVQAILSKAISKAASKQKIPYDVVSKLQSQLFPTLSREITTIIGHQAVALVGSTNPAEIKKALESIINVDDPEIIPEHKVVIQNYLKAMIAALCYLASLRATMCSLEGSLTQKLADAKLTQVANEIDIARQILTTQMKEASEKYAADLDSITQYENMKLWMPLAMMAFAIIMVGVAVASVVSAGAAFVAVGGLIAGIKLVVSAVSLAVTVASAATAVADFALQQVGTRTGVWERMTDSMDITDPAIRAVVVTAIQLLVNLITIVATAGVGGVVLANTGIATGAQIASGIAKASVNMATFAGSTIVGSVIGAVLGGGLLSLGLQKLAEVIFKDDQKASMIFTIILTIVISIAISIIAGKTLKSSSISAVAGVETAATSVSKTIDSIKEVFQKIRDTLNKILDNLKGMSTKLEPVLLLTQPQDLQAIGYSVDDAAKIVEITGKLRGLMPTTAPGAAAAGAAGKMEGVLASAQAAVGDATEAATKAQASAGELVEAVTAAAKDGTKKAAMDVATDAISYATSDASHAMTLTTQSTITQTKETMKTLQETSKEITTALTELQTIVNNQGSAGAKLLQKNVQSALTASQELAKEVDTTLASQCEQLDKALTAFTNGLGELASTSQFLNTSLQKTIMENIKEFFKKIIKDITSSFSREAFVGGLGKLFEPLKDLGLFFKLFFTDIKQGIEVLTRFIKWLGNVTIMRRLEDFLAWIKSFGKDFGELRAAWKGGVEVTAGSAKELESGMSKLKSLLKHLEDNSQEVMGKGIRFADWAKFGLNLWASVEKFKRAKFQEQFEKDMAVIGKNLSALQAISALVEGLQGKDVSDIMKDIMESAQVQADFFQKLLELVDSFIQTMSFRMSELAGKGGVYVAE